MAHAGRSIYDKIISACEICPLCEHQDVDSLDHYSPKSKYPAFSILPLNLVPCCSRCNKEKGEEHPATAEKQFIHPYFDNIKDHLWLRAALITGAPMAVIFFVEAPKDWSAIDQVRIHNHFNDLKLSRIYRAQAGRHLTGMRLNWVEIYESGGVDSIRKHLLQEAVSLEAVYTNFWQTALYRALADSDWFVNGGMYNIPAQS